VIVKITRTCISNIGSEDFDGTLPFICPPQNPSETISGGAAEQTLRVTVVESTDELNDNDKNNVSFTFKFTKSIFLHNTKVLNEIQRCWKENESISI
jgi:hypothetical protein